MDKITETHLKPQIMPHFDLQGQLHGHEAFPNLKDVKVVWVPTELVLLSEVFVPGKSRAQWQQALPYAFEEQLAQPVDSAFFKVLSRNSEGETSAAVVEKSVMQHWVETLSATGLDHVQLVADCFALPIPEVNEPVMWCAMQQQGRVLVRTGLNSGFAGTQAWCDLQQKVVSQVQTVKVDFVENPLELSSLEIKRLGLREGVFKPKSSQASPIKPWISPLMVASLLLVTWLGSLIWQTQELNRQTNELDAQTTTLFKQMFPEIKRIVNLKVQAKTALNSQSDSQQIGPVALSQHLAQLIASPKQIKVISLNWRGQEAQFLLSANALQPLQSLAEELKKNKAYRVSLEVQQMEASQVTARLVIHV